ncbi:MAG TPA: nucleoside triphosphate pyrophosphohydrolase [Aggregatilinea sp.]|jgi:tetrapyrrole methylase family protein/MazG family protein|uniref:nucleoside triphosphate pyrophosphohydrolase n=1 Tax=Aggregatilinea sp. TaxID=2806333 RepID=UPI002B5D0653|nr:nucleoside triphosphate pyrophosphohydrolase [Aggregatilinea sp.]HML22152.1 nucleoside triphosphate pyrophosphohydrolase [Aggregatilinea sp.]
MSSQLDLRRAEQALAALNLDPLNGLQLLDATRFSGQHHPPLNPDLPALILNVMGDDVALIRHVLLNQYPELHEVSVISFGRDDQPVVDPFQLVRLQADSTCWGSLVVLYVPALPEPGSFERFQETIAHLRAPEGCPWDRKQTHSSLRPYVLEETYEVLDALDAGDMDALREELGDLLLQIVLHSQIAVEAGEFRMADVIAAVNEKLIRRHPHVWGDVNVNNDEDVKVNWDKLKQVEKAETRDSRLDGVPKAQPALSQAFSYQTRAARVKFDWDTVEPVIAKIYEELDELKMAQTDDDRAAEAGDVLFATVNWLRWLDIDPESALRGANRRFYERFHYIEQQAAARGVDVDALSFEEMDALWDAAKEHGL